MTSPGLEECTAVTVLAANNKEGAMLSKGDDVGNHRAWARNFNAVRIIHKNEVTQDTSDVEIKLEV
eukprot:1155076-Pelagomonas_calceolata.AAC.3